MRPVSAALLATVRQPHRRAARVSVLDAALNPLPGAILTGEDGYALEGMVSMDRTRDVRRTCSLSLANPAGIWTPTAAGDLFYWDRLLRLERGVYLSATEIEWCSLGVFVIDQPVVEVGAAGSTLRLTGVDLMDRVLRSKFTAPTTYAAGTTLRAVVAALATDAGIGATRMRLDDGGKTLAVARTWEVDQLRLDALRDVTTDYSLEVYLDADGVLVLEPWRDPATATEAWIFEPGADAIMTGLSKGYSKDLLYNHILVRGESAEGTLVQAEAFDDNPASVTYYLGPLGDRLYTYTSAMITTVPQAQAVADMLLVEHALIEEELRVPFVPMPALEAGDSVRIREPDSATDDRYQVQRLSMPLGAGTATLDVRKLRSLL